VETGQYFYPAIRHTGIVQKVLMYTVLEGY